MNHAFFWRLGDSSILSFRHALSNRFYVFEFTFRSE